MGTFQESIQPRKYPLCNKHAVKLYPDWYKLGFRIFQLDIIHIKIEAYRFSFNVLRSLSHSRLLTSIRIAGDKNGQNRH